MKKVIAKVRWRCMAVGMPSVSCRFFFFSNGFWNTKVDGAKHYFSVPNSVYSS